MLQVLLLPVLGMILVTHGFHMSAPKPFTLNSPIKPTALTGDSESHLLNTQKTKVDGEEKIDDIIKQAEELKKMIKKLEKQNTQKEDMIQTLQATLKGKGAKNGANSPDSTGYTELIQSLRLKVQEQESTIASQESKISSQESTISSQDSTISSQNSTISSQESKINSQESKITSLEQDQTINGRKVHEMLVECQTNETKTLIMMNATAMKLNVCEKELHGSTQVQNCPPFFTNDEGAGICFGLMFGRVNFTLAQQACEKIPNYNARLAVLDTQAKFDSVREKVKPTNARFWIGAQRMGDGFQWLDGSMVSMEYGWFPGEPNNAGEKCADLLETEDSMMNDDQCDFGNHFVCEVIQRTEN